MPWCEHCRDHFSASHYEDGDHHMVGAEYGPTGAFLEALPAAERLRDGLAETERNDAQTAWYAFVSVDDIETVVRAFQLGSAEPDDGTA